MSRCLCGVPEVKDKRRFYCTQHGYFWSMNRQQFERFLRHAASGEEWDLSHFGKPLGRKPPYNNYTFRVLDWGPEEAQVTLDELLGGKKYFSISTDRPWTKY